MAARKPNPFFRFKEFTVYHDRCAMKVTTDGCVFGAWVAKDLRERAGDRMLDIGTGTGLLSMMIAQQFGGAIDALEIDAAAASQARENVGATPWSDRIEVMETDLLQFRPAMPYSIIVSNPPFYEKELASPGHQRSIAHHGKSLTVSRLMEWIANHLCENGVAYLLLPQKRERDFEKLMTGNGLHLHRRVGLKQSTNHGVFRLMLKIGKNEVSQIQRSELSIKDEEGHYTNEIAALLRPYYLYL